jgi:hypothetical protein
VIINDSTLGLVMLVVDTLSVILRFMVFLAGVEDTRSAITQKSANFWGFSGE